VYGSSVRNDFIAFNYFVDSFKKILMKKMAEQLHALESLHRRHCTAMGGVCKRQHVRDSIIHLCLHFALFCGL